MNARGKSFNKFFIILLSLLSTTFLYSGSTFVDDVDHDGFPDDLERATGYNPAVNEALVKSAKEGACGKVDTDLVKLGNPDNVLIILDISGSMTEEIEKGMSKMDLAKKLMAKYIDALPSSMKIGLVIYGKGNCGDDSIELLAPIGKRSKRDLKKMVQGLKPYGATPIAYTLGKCTEYFKGFEKENNNLVLISDGGESCGGNPIQAIKDLKKTSANPKVTVIGIKVDSATRKQLKGIADTAGGVYADVRSKEDMIKAFAEFFKEMNKFYKDIVCIIRQYNSYLTYATQQHNKSKSYLINAKMKAKGDMGDVLDKLEKQLDINQKEREEGQYKLDKMIKNKLKDSDEAIRNFVSDK